MKRLAILASGSGSNAENIIRYFENHESIKVTSIVTNRKEAKVLERAKKLNVPAEYFPKKAFLEEEIVLDHLLKNADYVILAGFLLKIPQNIVDAYPDKIINIHPALLPKFGGKGMYGMNVHTAVKEQGETETGITIHFVNENYDEGAIIFQAKTAVSASDSPEDIANNIHQLEYAHFPKVIEEALL
ncbi:phosphoribosylglycinamide formyltransferase [Flavicella sp.]|uniref:phosphoribosylglycinamide formyltransferase n=1 Tax=Flavicella sp. TaxID=2957742 RepID=UPI00261E9DF0|nr:phosphoribosylglycinamide formyltransferase [Flavicella sp.]MDG1805012.1 phosphoribosylglycinamide formyltransferase [Flavicella sp.]MDG2281088.1 phosphoribosylglycinamide formyltransferase [Flavicella sp.]